VSDRANGQVPARSVEASQHPGATPGLSPPIKKINLPNSAVNGEDHNNMDSRGRFFYTKLPGCSVAQYDRGDYVKVEFPEDTPGVPGEWMWVRVHHCDEEHQILFGTLDNEPVVNTEDLQLGQELAISYRQIREHRKPSEFRKN
jgi:hypothetical protein